MYKLTVKYRRMSQFYLGNKVITKILKPKSHRRIRMDFHKIYIIKNFQDVDFLVLEAGIDLSTSEKIVNFPMQYL